MKMWIASLLMMIVTVVVVVRAQLPLEKCSTLLTFQGKQRSYAQCQDLNSRPDAYGPSIAWSHFPNATLDIAFTGNAASSSGWVAWGLNPHRQQMTGTSALIAFSNADGAHVKEYMITSEIQGGSPLFPSQIEVIFLNQSVEIIGPTMRIFATVHLPLLKNTSSSDSEAKKTMLTHVWNWGSHVIGESPQAHAFDVANLLAVRSIDMSSGQVIGSKLPRQRLKRVHGITSVAGWGILLPLGVMCARYLRSFECWFHLHLGFQIFGYVIGSVGWIIGMKLGSESKGIIHHKHRNVGIGIFVCGSLQMLAMVLRPDKKKKIMRKYWNLYHHSVGYSTIALGITNIFVGIKILHPSMSWKNAYIGILILLGGVSFVAEMIYWAKFIKRGRAAAVDGGDDGKRESKGMSRLWTNAN